MTIPATSPLETPSAEVIPITHARAHSGRPASSHLQAATESFSSIGDRQRIIDLTNAARLPAKRRPPEPPSLADEAFWRIAGAAGQEGTGAERSNEFDEWKDRILLLAEQLGTRDVAASAIVGALLLAARKKDVTDFSVVQLEAFRDATAKLRLARPSELDAKQVIRLLQKQKISTHLPLAVDSDASSEHVRTLEALMERFSSG
jgi:hypothetical protein